MKGRLREGEGKVKSEGEKWYDFYELPLTDSAATYVAICNKCTIYSAICNECSIHLLQVYHDPHQVYKELYHAYHNTHNVDINLQIENQYWTQLMNLSQHI